MKKLQIYFMVLTLVLLTYPSHSYAATTTQKATTNSAKLILAGVDSLTNGAGGSSYFKILAPRIKANYGDGGPGYVPIDYTFAKEDGYSFGKSSGLTYISQVTPGKYPTQYSLDLKGIYTDSGTGKDYFDYNLSSQKWKHATLFYLKQPGGGTFKIGYTKENVNSYITVNSNSKTVELGVIKLPDNDAKKAGQISARNIKGKVAIFGGLFTNDKGYAVSRIGKGGDKLAWHNNTNASFRAAYLRVLQPSLFIFNGGMNDRTELDAPAYEKTFSSYLSSFLAAKSKLLIVRPNAIDGDNTILDQYEQALLAFAEKNNAGFLSNKKVLGETYEAAKVSMLDGIHPNAEGNKKISNSIYSFLIDSKLLTK